MGWLTQYFLHPAMVPVGAALVAAPIIIHLINRMRFRRVRFAAMEFLLASQQRNRRRVLIEQLILLLLRILIVLALLALIARLVLDPSLSVFDRGKSHHVVLLDDSLSMQERVGETTAFEEGLDVIKKLVAKGAENPQTQTFTLILLSRPDQPLEERRDVDRQLQTELDTKLDGLECKHQAFDITAGLEAAGKLLKEDVAATKYLHVVSDFRRANWQGQKAIAQATSELDEAGVAVNLVRTIAERSENLAVTQFSAESTVAAAGIALGLRVGVTNFGDTVAEDVRVDVWADGEKLPLSVTFDKIEAGKEALATKYVTFETPGTHRVHVELEADALSQDNRRYLAIDIPPANPVLIVTPDVNGDSAFVVATALAPEFEITGMATLIEDVDYLRRNPLDRFRSIFLLNVPELPPDALVPLREYVAGGGGLVWFLGDAVDPVFYTQNLYEEGGKGLFPVPLGIAPSELPPDESVEAGPDLVVRNHPVFEKTIGAVNPLLSLVRFEQWIPVREDWPRDDNVRKDGVSTIATLRGRDPLAFEHSYGKGRVITFLSSAGPEWNDWHTNRSFLLIVQELQRRVARENQTSEERTVGRPVLVSVDPAQYDDSMTIILPGDGENRALEIGLEVPQADNTAQDSGLAAPSRDARTPDPAPDDPAPAPDVRVATYADTDRPGIYVYSVTSIDPARPDLERYFAYNTPVEESDLALVDDEAIQKAVGEDVRVQIQKPGDIDWIEITNPGQEVRRFVLIVLLALLIAEQLMAYRVSYHPMPAGAAA
ncbi:MAG: BatA domain-containing protein [Planctomycetes bacterium]|nr:BatA domain-containing protein [Planctomycetota bacterium]